MVNKVLSRYDKNPPKGAVRVGSEQVIDGGPLYEDIVTHLDRCTLIPLTSNCSLDLMNHEISMDQVRVWIKDAVAKGGYINSQWCEGSKPGTIAACDAYSCMGILRDIKSNKLKMHEIYLKFCLAKSGNTILTISIHPSIFQQEIL